MEKRVFTIPGVLVVIAAIFVLFAPSRSIHDTTLNRSDSARAGEAEAKESSRTTEEVSLITVGDIMPSRGVARQIRKYKSAQYPFLKTKDFLASADIVFGNLESPITPGRIIASGEMTFRTDPEVADALRDAGVTVLSLANNHIPNFGAKGIRDTLEHLQRVSIAAVGAGMTDAEAVASAVITAKGMRFAFLAYNDPDVVPVSYEARADRAGTAFMNIKRMSDAVQAATQTANHVIVSMHSGHEYTHKANASQTAFAHAAIDAGADLVIGHHPHVIQPVEIYKGRYIFYSLGNFIFDQMWSRDTREGVALKIIFSEDGVVRVGALPVLIEDYAQPRALDGKEADAALKKLVAPLSRINLQSFAIIP